MIRVVCPSFQMQTTSKQTSGMNYQPKCCCAVNLLRFNVTVVVPFSRSTSIVSRLRISCVCASKQAIKIDRLVFMITLHRLHCAGGRGTNLYAEQERRVEVSATAHIQLICRSFPSVYFIIFPPLPSHLFRP